MSLLSAFIKLSKGLKWLRLANNSIANMGAAELALALPSSDVQHVDISNCSIGPSGGQALVGKQRCPLAGLKSLNLLGNALGLTVSKQLIEFFEKEATIGTLHGIARGAKSVDWSGSSVRPSTLPILAAEIGQYRNTALVRSLSLGNNPLSGRCSTVAATHHADGGNMAGMQALSGILSTTLASTVDICNCGLGPIVGSEWIMGGLSSTITDLDLSHNACALPSFFVQKTFPDAAVNEGHIVSWNKRVGVAVSQPNRHSVFNLRWADNGELVRTKTANVAVVNVERESSGTRESPLKKDFSSWRAVCEALSKSRVVHLNLSGCGLSAPAAAVMAVTLLKPGASTPSPTRSRFGALRTVDLLQNPIELNGLKTIADAVGANPLISSICGYRGSGTFDVSNRQLRAGDLDILSTELSLGRTAAKATAMDLRCNDLLEYNVAKGEEKFSSIQALKRFCVSLRTLSRITMLSLRGIGLGPKALMVLARGLSQSCTVLDISDNPLLSKFGRVCTEGWVHFLNVLATANVAKLEIAGIGIGPISANMLLESAVSARFTASLQHIDVSHNVLGLDGGRALSQLVSREKSPLVSICVGGRPGGGAAYIPLCDSALTMLDVSASGLRVGGALVLSACVAVICKMGALRALNVLHNPIGETGLRAVLEVVGRFPAVASICGRLPNVGGLGPYAASALRAEDCLLLAAELGLCSEHGPAALTQTDGVRTLDLSQSPDLMRIHLTGDSLDGWSKLCRALSRAWHVDVLRCQAVGMTPPAATMLASAMREVEWRELDVRSNPLGDAGMETLARSLTHGSRAVLRLLAADCSVGARGARSLAASCALGTLTALDLSDNARAFDGATDILSTLLHAPGMEELALARCGLDATVAMAAAHGVHQARSLRRLDLRGNELGAGPGALHLAECVLAHARLLDFDGMAVFPLRTRCRSLELAPDLALHEAMLLGVALAKVGPAGELVLTRSQGSPLALSIWSIASRVDCAGVLQLSKLGLGDVGAVALAGVLRHHLPPAVTRVCVGENLIGTDGAQALFDALAYGAPPFRRSTITPAPTVSRAL